MRIVFLRAKYTFSLSTTSANGILVISLNEKTSRFDYEILYLEGGKIRYTFNLGAGPVTITSQSTVNDGKRHTVVATRRSRDGNLKVDGVSVKGKGPGTLSSMNSIIRLFIGGAPNNFATFQKVPVSFVLHFYTIKLQSFTRDFAIGNMISITTQMAF